MQAGGRRTSAQDPRSASPQPGCPATCLCGDVGRHAASILCLCFIRQLRLHCLEACKSKGPRIAENVVFAMHVRPGKTAKAACLGPRALAGSMHSPGQHGWRVCKAWRNLLLSRHSRCNTTGHFRFPPTLLCPHLAPRVRQSRHSLETRRTRRGPRAPTRPQKGTWVQPPPVRE